MNKNTEISKAASIMGKKGGNVSLKKYGTKFFSDNGKKGMASRWGKKDVIDK
jgi:hypothetical protein